MLDDRIRTLFLSIPPSAHEAAYNGPWNVLLTKCFPFEEGFIVVPSGPVADGRDRIDYLMQAFEVKQIQEMQECDVFILEINKPGDLNLASKRKAADTQMRKRFGDVGNIPPTLHAASAFGTKLRLYKKDRETGTVTPHIVRPCKMERETRRVRPGKTQEDDPNMIVDTCPESWWEKDVLTEAGYDELMKVVAEVKGQGRQELTSSHCYNQQ